MSIVVALKFFHYLALFLAGGLGVANAMLFKNHQKAEMTPSAPVQKTMMTLARLGLLSILLLWATGIPLSRLVYGTFALGWAFHLKLLAATFLLSIVAFLNIHLTMQARNGKLPNPKVMKIVPPIMRASLVFVLIGIAVLTTTV